MTIKKSMDFNIRAVPIESLKKHYKSKEILGYCKKCPNYNMNWSCPPHDFNVGNYLKQYRMAYIIGVKIYLEEFSEKSDSLNYYYDCRHSTNQSLLQYERAISDSTVLIGGHCNLCDKCTRQISLGCRYPDRKRYSFESLGFKVSEIIEDLFHDKLQFKKDKKPESLYVVLGVLTDAELDVNKLIKFLAEKNMKTPN